MTHDALTLPDATAYVADLLTNARRLSDVAMIATHTFETCEAANELALSAISFIDQADETVTPEAALAATLALMLDHNVSFDYPDDLFD